MYMKRTNSNQKRYIHAQLLSINLVRRKAVNDIVMKCSPAYATTEFKKLVITLLTITLCRSLYACTYTYSTADDILMKNSPAYSTVQQSQSVI